MYKAVLSIMVAFAVSHTAIPVILEICREYQLHKSPGKRSSHITPTPELGGIAVFLGLFFSSCLFIPYHEIRGLPYIVAAFALVFIMGLKDDLLPIPVRYKFLGQAVAAFLIASKGGVRLSSLYGLLWVQDGLPSVVYFILSILIILFIINAFNFIDGIDGLAGSIGVLSSGCMGAWFYWAGVPSMAILSFALFGALLGFLKYNYSPAKIFMGDSGSTTIGLAMAVLLISFMETSSQSLDARLRVAAIPAVAICIAIVPIYDTLRVIITRLARRQFPFYPDRRHVHHLLIDYGFSHLQATGILVVANAFFILLAFSLERYLDLHPLLILILIFATVLTYLLYTLARKSRQQKPQA